MNLRCDTAVSGENETCDKMLENNNFLYWGARVVIFQLATLRQSLELDLRLRLISLESESETCDLIFRIHEMVLMMKSSSIPFWQLSPISFDHHHPLNKVNEQGEWWWWFIRDDDHDDLDLLVLGTSKNLY